MLSGCLVKFLIIVYIQLKRSKLITWKSSHCILHWQRQIKYIFEKPRSYTYRLSFVSICNSLLKLSEIWPILQWMIASVQKWTTYDDKYEEKIMTEARWVPQTLSKPRKLLFESGGIGIKLFIRESLILYSCVQDSTHSPLKI